MPTIGCAFRPTIPHTPCARLAQREEEKGYYYGFANEGLWPLCHIAIPARFSVPRTGSTITPSTALRRRRPERDGKRESPIVLVQDYISPCCPAWSRRPRPTRPSSSSGTFPGRTPEVFGICPWQREFLDGLLGADLIGFHIQYHCNNFLETVDRALEALTGSGSLCRQPAGPLTRVRPYPISVHFRERPPSRTYGSRGSPISARKCARSATNSTIHATLLGVGVDRVDYTKGILERFRAVERFLDQYPIPARFSLIQIGAPSRTISMIQKASSMR